MNPKADVLHQVRLLSNLEADGTLCWCQHVFGQQLEPRHTAPCAALREYFARHDAAPPRPYLVDAPDGTAAWMCPTCHSEISFKDRSCRCPKVAAPPQPAEPPAVPQSHLSTCPTCTHAMQEIDKGTLWTCLLPTCKDFGIQRMWPDRG